MNSAIERLLTLRVADAMTKNVVSVSSSETMAEAAGKLLERSISGAPVLDEKTRCAGMLSAIDFMKNKSGAASSANELVADHMTRDVKSIAAGDTILGAARMMCAKHIHRLPVLNDERQIIGMITALDIVAALVNAIEE